MEETQDKSKEGSIRSVFKDVLREVLAEDKASGKSVLGDMLEKDKTEYKDVPIDVYKFFKANIGKISETEIKKLKKISKWIFDGDTDLEAGLKKLRDLEIKLGLPRSDEYKWDKIFNHLGIEANIKELEKKQKVLEN